MAAYGPARMGGTSTGCADAAHPRLSLSGAGTAHVAGASFWQVRPTSLSMECPHVSSVARSPAADGVQQHGIVCFTDGPGMTANDLQLRWPFYVHALARMLVREIYRAKMDLQLSA